VRTDSALSSEFEQITMEAKPVRITTLLRRLIGVTQIQVRGVRWAGDGLEIDVRPSWREPRCASCGRRAPGYDQQPARRWRHVPWGAVRVDLVYAPRRVQCPSCGIDPEQVPWAVGASRFTQPMEELAAWLATITDRTSVTQVLGTSWRAVGRMIERVVVRKLDGERLADLRLIGIDEFSYRKRHRYVTVVVDHERGRVVWAAEGRSAETLHAFFDALGAEGTARLEAITIDMAGGYIKAIEERAPEATIVFDRFHVQRLASDAVDEVRRSVMRELDSSQEKRAVKHTRFALLKNPWNLSPIERGRLAELQRVNRPLYRAYLLKESLAEILASLRPEHARDALARWLGWASRSRLKPFVRLARTIRQHRDGILTYLFLRLTNGLVEGLNNRIRMVARRAFGFHSAQALIAMMYLVCAGIQLEPTLP
jgi:transposase